MSVLLETAAANAVLAGGLAVIVFAITRFIRQPTVGYWLWALVLLKLVTPPLVEVPLFWLPAEESGFDAVMSGGDGLRGGSEEAGPRLARIGANAEVPGSDFEEETVGGESEGVSEIVSTAAPDSEMDGVEHVEQNGVFVESEEPLWSSSPAASAVTAEATRWSWRNVLLCCWGIGSVLWFAVAAGRIVQFGRLLRRAEGAPGWIQEETDRLAGRFGLKRAPRVVTAGAQLPPLVWSAGGRAVLFLPRELLASMDARELSLLLAHELAHLRRGDHRVRWLEAAVLGLFWWHPAAWWARRELQRCEEECCDAWVLWAFPQEGKTYAEALLRTLDFLSEVRAALPATASGVRRTTTFQRRFEMILKNRPSRVTPWSSRAALVVFAGFALGVSGTLTRGEAPEEEGAAVSAVEAEESGSEVLPELQSQRPEAKQETPATISSDQSPADPDATGQSQGPARDRVHQVEQTKSDLKIVEGSTRIVELPKKIKSVYGFDEAIIKVATVDSRPNRLRVTAVDPGVTTLLLADDQGTTFSIDLLVERDVRQLQAQLDRLFPDVSIEVIGVSVGGVLLRGRVSQPEQIKQIVEVAERHYGDVLNQLRVGGPESDATVASQPARVNVPKNTLVGGNIVRTTTPGPMVDRVAGPSSDLIVDWTTTSSISAEVRKEVQQALLKALEDESVEVRKGAIAALGRVGTSSDEVREALVKLLENENNGEILSEALSALAAVRKTDQETIDLFCRFLGHGEKDVRTQAMEYLRVAGEREPAVIAALIEKVHAEEPAIPRSVASAASARGVLATITPQSDDVVRALVKATRDENKTVRWCAIKALGNLNRKGSTGSWFQPARPARPATR